MVTAYDAPSGRLADAAGADLILVGDSAAMTVLGHDSTVPATMEEMLVLTRAVTRGARRPLVVADMPFGSFQVSDEEAVRNAIRFVKEAGADAVKLEGAGPTLARVQRARRRRHPGDGPPRADAAVGDDARRLQGAGPDGREGGAPLRGRARARGRRLLRDRARGRPGAGRGADHRGADRADDRDRRRRARDGQVLVWHDLLGLYEGHAPRFVKQYADLADEIKKAVGAYVEEVRERRFPEEQHTYAMPEEELALFEEALEDEARSRTPLGRGRRARGRRASAPTSSRGRRARRRAAARPTRRKAELEASKSRRRPVVGAAAPEEVAAEDERARAARGQAARARAARARSRGCGAHGGTCRRRRARARRGRARRRR